MPRNLLDLGSEVLVSSSSVLHSALSSGEREEDTALTCGDGNWVVGIFSKASLLK